MRRTVIALLALVAGVLGPWLAPPSVTAAASADPVSWETLSKLSRGVLPAVSCASTSWCWAVGGGELLASTDAGATWTTRSAQVPASVDGLDAVDCPAVGTCYVTARLEGGGNAVLVVTAGAITSSPAPGGAALSSISCTTARRCLALVGDGQGVVVTSDAGASWLARPKPRPAGLFAVSCVAGTTTCTGVGSSAGDARVARTDNFGVSWTVQTPPGGTDVLRGVDCSSLLVCHAGGYLGFGAVAAATTDGGATWTRQRLPDTSGRLGSVSCPSDDVCWAFGANFSEPIGFGTTDGGTTWVRQSLPSGTGFDAVVSCPTTTDCAAVARIGVGFTTDNGGAAWQPVGIPPALNAFQQLSCPAVDRCVAMTRDVSTRPLALTSTDGGRTWTRRTLPDGTAFVTSLDCATPTSCVAWASNSVNGRTNGQALLSSDGGVTWRLVTGPTLREPAAADVSCLDALTCIAVGAGRRAPQVRTTVDGGATWQVAAGPADATRLARVACGTGFCVLLGTTGPVTAQVSTAWRTTDLAATYATRVLPADGAYNDVDCERVRCVAVGNDSVTSGIAAWSTSAGNAWRPATLPTGTGSLREAACGLGICVVSGLVGAAAPSGVLVSTDQGRTYVPVGTPSDSARTAAVACAPTRQKCLASDVSASGYPRVVGTP